MNVNFCPHQVIYIIPCADCNSHHRSVTASISMKLKSLNKQTAVPKVQFNSSEDVDYKTEYVIAVRNRYELLFNIEEVEDKEPSRCDTTKCITGY